MRQAATRQSGHVRRSAPLAAVATLGVGVLLAAAGDPAGDVPRAKPGDGAAPGLVEFNRQIRPILSDKCFRCHGPDAAARQAGLRLDRRADALADRGDRGAAIIPGDGGASLLARRITSDDDDFRMPPPESGKSLTPEEIALLRRWIDEGATWQVHWSFLPPRRAELPATPEGADVANPIDAFILARLDEAGLSPSPRASRTTLIRRVTLDLTGLPPTPEEVDAFLADDSPQAYERVVDRLLASPRFGEHMARTWLDAARYGDTHGLHLDNRRSMWRWRDWVIDAFNRNVPFDRFTVEQLAGDLLPEPTRDQLIATGFNRNNVTTSEGGAIDAEYLVKYAADRLETTATVWMGLTVGCAQCHDHKFDPISQREYYELFAFFNNITENAMDGNKHDPPPVIAAPTPEQEAKLASLEESIAALEAELDAPMEAIDAAQREWETERRAREIATWQVLVPEELTSSGGAELAVLEDGSVRAGGPNPDVDVHEFTFRTDLEHVQALRLEALTDESLPHGGPGRADNANFVLSEIEVEAWPAGQPDAAAPVRLVAATADHEQMNGPYLVASAIDGVIDATNGWAVEGFVRREKRTALFAAAEPFGFPDGTALRVRLRYETHFPRHAIGRVRISASDDEDLARVFAPSVAGPWHQVGPFTANDGTEAFKLPFGPEQSPGAIDLGATYQEGTFAWVEHPEYADGVVHPLDGGDASAIYLYRAIESPTARGMLLALGSDDAIKVWVNGELVLEKLVPRAAALDQDRLTIRLDPGVNHVLLKIVNLTGEHAFAYQPLREGIESAFLRVADVLAIAPENRTEDQRTLLRRFYRERHCDALAPQFEAVESRREALADLRKSLPVTLVMNERDERRETFVLRRGEYDQPLDPVEPGVPAVLPALPATHDDRPADRLALARWLVDPAHPLTARVTVNRLWQQVFGTGLVRTAEDFGAQGEWPSHPDLLDWLACEFVESGWDVKAMLRLMVTSATYRQSSRVDPETLAVDPENRLLARGPRFRLDAEVIRDQALAAGGLLVGTIGGPPVKPYQPSGLWSAVAYPDSDTRTFVADEGEKLYRRSLYTFWKRTSPPPSLTTFDAPTRETCTVRRPRTNTPLQALVLLNDVQFVEAARHLAQRVLQKDDASAGDAIARLFRIVTARAPDAVELRTLLALHDAQLARYEQAPEEAAALLAVGASPADPDLDAAALAAMTNVATVVFNLDEAVTRE